jgi:predicted membrane metal-binding protein
MFYDFPPTSLYAPLLGLLAGIIVGYCPFTIYTGIAALGLLVTGLLLAQQHLSFVKTTTWLLLFFCTGIGLTLYKNKSQNLPPVFINYSYKVVNLEKAQSDDWPYKVTLQTVVQTWWQISYTCMVYTRYKPFLWVGDTIKIPELVIQSPKDPHFGLYLKKEGIDGTAFIFCLKSYKRERPKYNLLRFIHGIKQGCIASTKAVLDIDAYALFLSVFLGNKDEQKQTLEHIRPIFLYWGLSHQLARSGLHLLFFIPLLMLLISLLPMPFVIKELLLITIVGMYALFSWTSISFLRACCCFFILRASHIFSFYLPPLHILMLTATLVLLHNPLQLFFLDFQLSFFLSLSLLWISHIHHVRGMNDKKILICKK